MKVSFEAVEKILKGLPIGYYAKSRVPVVLSKGDKSFIDMISRNITISYPLICSGLETVDDEEYLPIAVRTMLYHEVGHAILTPVKMNCDKINNIFEDERLETILQPYFVGVDFKNNIKRICDYPNYETKSALDVFFKVVRFREGKKEWVDEVEKIIYRYNYIRGNHSACTSYWYEKDIKKLWEEICKEYEADPSIGETNNSSSSSGSDDMESEDSSCSMDSTPDKPDFSNKPISELLREMLGDSNAVNEYRNQKLEQTLMQIIESFNRKNNSGSAIQAHSGIINPRLVGRPDYRIFERQSTCKGVNRFGTVHINLFLDESGSYCMNQHITNQLISALAQVEKYNKSFTFDIVYCGEGERLVDKTDRQMYCAGGNYLDDKIFEIYKKLQKPNTYNYNIILFDGDAFTDCPYGVERSVAQRNFGAFNHSNCTIISDPSNMTAINNYASSANRIFTYEYASKLIENVTNAIRFAFR